MLFKWSCQIHSFRELYEVPPRHAAHIHSPLLTLNDSLIITNQSAGPVVIKQTANLRR